MRNTTIILILLASSLFTRSLFVNATGFVADKDSIVYTRIADNILKGNGFSSDISSPYRENNLRLPWYPIFLAATGRFWLLVQVMISAATVVVVFLISRSIMNRRLSIASSVIFMLSPASIFLSCSIMTETLFTFFVAVSVYFIVKRNSDVASFFALLATFIRPVGVILSIFVVFHKFGYRRTRVDISFALLAIVLSQSVPDMNSFAYGRALMSFSNNEVSWASSVGDSGLCADELHRLTLLVGSGWRAVPHAINSMKADGWTSRRISKSMTWLYVRSALRNPFGFLRFVFKNAANMVTSPAMAMRMIGTNNKYCNVFIRTIMLSVFVLFIIGCAKMWVIAYRPVWLFVVVVVWVALHSLFLGNDRLMFPMYPIVIPFAVYAFRSNSLGRAISEYYRGINSRRSADG